MFSSVHSSTANKRQYKNKQKENFTWNISLSIKHGTFFLHKRKGKVKQMINASSFCFSNKENKKKTEQKMQRKANKTYYMLNYKQIN